MVTERARGELKEREKTRGAVQGQQQTGSPFVWWPFVSCKLSGREDRGTD